MLERLPATYHSCYSSRFADQALWYRIGDVSAQVADLVKRDPHLVVSGDVAADRVRPYRCRRRQVAGNRWSRSIDETREATVALLVSNYRTRLRSFVQHGGTNTTEVGGLAVALKRPAVVVTDTVKLTDGTEKPLDLSIPDVANMLGLKLHARGARDEDRDAIGLWTCMELFISAQEIDEFRSSEFDDVRDQLGSEFGDDGRSTRVVIAGVVAPCSPAAHRDRRL